MFNVKSWRNPSIISMIVVLLVVVACTSLQNKNKQAESTQVSQQSIENPYSHFPNPTEWTEETPVRIYNPLSFSWQESSYGQVKLENEFITEGYLFFNSERGLILRPAIDITKLEGANTGFNPEVDISPKPDDVVYLFRSPEDKQPNGHYRLADVNIDSDVVYYGRVWRWSKAANGENYQLSKTDQVFAEVLATHQEVHEGDIYDLTVQFHGCGQQGTITGSAEHPFYVLDTNDYVNMADLQAGMALKTDDGTTATVVNLTHLPEETKTLYNLTVAHANNFYVQANDGDAALLVHNTGPCKWGAWSDLEKIVHNGREYALVNDRYFTQEMVQRMTPQNYGDHIRGYTINGSARVSYSSRGIPPSVIDDVITNGHHYQNIRGSGPLRDIYELNGVRIVTEEAGQIVVTGYRIGDN